MAGPSWFENQLLAREHKKKLLEKMLSGKKKPLAEPESTDVVAHTAAEPPSEPQHEEVARQLYEAPKVAFFDRSGEVPFAPGDALRNLATLYLEAADNRTAAIALVWPSVINVLPLVHTVATLQRWQVGDKLGVRGLLFPAKQNSFYPLNHVFLDTDALVALANELYEEASPNAPRNPRVTRSLHEKDPFLFLLGTLRLESKGQIIRPCVNELLPHFFLAEANATLGNYGSEFYEHLIGRLRSRKWKGDLRNQFQNLGDPKSSPDSLFALSYRLSPEELRNALRQIHHVGAPEVLLLDATRPARIALGNWRRRLSLFIEIASEVFSERAPGLLVVTDDPRAIGLLKSQLYKDAERARQKGKRQTSPILKVNAIACPTISSGLQAVGSQECSAPELRQYAVRIMDAEAASVVQKFLRLTGESRLTPDEIKPLRSAVDFLTRLSGLPCGVRMLSDWMEERQFTEQARGSFTWPTYRAALMRFVNEGLAGPARSTLETALEQADQIWRRCENATPFALAMLEEIRNSLATGEKVQAVFTKPVYKLLAERYLNAQLDAEHYGRVTCHLSGELCGMLGQSAGQLVMAGIDDEILRVLVVDNRIPDNTKLLLTHRTATYLQQSLDPILGFPEMAAYQPRILGLLSQLQKLGTSDGSILLQSEDFVLPTFSFSNAEREVPSDFDDADAWRIELEEGETLLRRGSATAYVYDPANPDAGPGGFRKTTFQELHAGDRVFDMSSELREVVEVELTTAGVDLAHDRPFEPFLRAYHKRIIEQLNRYFKAKTLEGQVRLLREHIEQENPELTDLPKHIKHWVDLGKAEGTEFQELLPHAPRRFKHFEVFCKSLHLESSEINLHWSCAINPIRVSRIKDGRSVSDIYTRSLFDPASAVIYQRLSRETLDGLYERALENVHMVTGVSAPKNGDNKELDD